MKQHRRIEVDLRTAHPRVKKIGWFHQWITDANGCWALVEFEDGKVEAAPFYDVRFVTPLSENS